MGGCVVVSMSRSGCICYEPSCATNWETVTSCPASATTVVAPPSAWGGGLVVVDDGPPRAALPSMASSARAPAAAEPTQAWVRRRSPASSLRAMTTAERIGASELLGTTLNTRARGPGQEETSLEKGFGWARLGPRRSPRTGAWGCLGREATGRLN